MPKPKIIPAFCIIAAILAGWSIAAGPDSRANTESQRVRARIGILIKSGERTMRAKGQETLKTGDRFQVHIKPEGAVHIYVVRSDRKTATLLKAIEQADPGTGRILPGAGEFYKVSGESPVETVTIICSPQKLEELSPLLKSQLSYEKWAPVEKELLARGEIELGTASAKPFPIAGAVKEMAGKSREPSLADEPPGESKEDSLISEIPMFSGDTIIAKQYVFNIRK
jgi:hypothetical protein